MLLKPKICKTKGCKQFVFQAREVLCGDCLNKQRELT